MIGKRLWHTFRLWMYPNSSQRTRYLKDHKVFASLGDNCSIMSRDVPLYANLIRIGNNVHLASKVSFIVHDIAHVMLNRVPEKTGGIQEHLDCIEVGNNVFIGAGTRILGGVRIGNNVIVGAASLVNKDIPDNSVAAGVPAKVIGSFDDFYEKRINEEKYPNGMRPHIGREVPNDLADWLWDRFYARRRENG